MQRIKLFDRGGMVPPDAGGWIKAAAFEELRFLEVFLDGEARAFEIAAFGSLLYSISKPTDEPIVPKPTKLEVEDAWAEWEGRATSAQRLSAEAVLGKPMLDRVLEWWRRR